MIRRCMTIIFCLVAMRSAVSADDFRTVTVVAEVPFSPDRVVVLLSRPGQAPVRTWGVLVGPSDDAEAGKSRWYAGARVPASLLPEKSQVAAIFFDRSGNAYASPLTLVDVALARALDAQIRDEVEARRRDLATLKIRHQQQEESLARARAQAALVANVDRIVDVREEARLAEEQLTSLERESGLLKSAVESIKASPAPRNFTRRELDLVKSVGELHALAQSVEKEVRAKRGETEARSRRVAMLLEQAKDVDPVELRRKLEELRRRRIALEGGPS